MADKKVYLRLNIDGRDFEYYVSPSEEKLFVRAEEIINGEIQLLRKNRATQSYTYDRLLGAVLIKLVVSDLRKGEDSKELFQELNNVNSSLSSYLEKN